MHASPLLEALVVAAHGRQYRVELENGDNLLCFPRGKKSEIACGDHVRVRRGSETQGVIETLLPRASLLYRSNAFRQKLIAANVDQIVFVIATEPAFSEDLIERCLIAAASQHIAPLLVLNKCDLSGRLPAARAALAGFLARDVPVLELSARNDAAALLPHLSGKTSVLVGQSGMGKSTLVNALVPEAAAATREISAALDSGKHTTTHATLYRLDAQSRLMDSPGLQAFGLAHLSREELTAAFPEFAPWLGECRFRDCRHASDAGCALVAAAARGDFAPERLALFQMLAAEARV
ncbi:MAG: ribosome small subunit-dependent GTPase A [Zoogloeaceae bacterium]|jgi:ribosome biogenesis GTPase|nr:ribosome small subunit-dependent GTPase A [Zoogloeaceae bacterium]